jgi:plastocyanin
VGLSVAIATAAGQVKTRSAAAVVKIPVITVTAGKPSEFAFKLSKTSNLTAGKISFKVTNQGVIGHSFKICTKAVTTSTANTCVGVATKVLNKGQSQTLTVTLKKGIYEFLCTVSGHAGNGMKGLVGVATVLSAAQAKPATSGGTAAGGGAAGAGAACASPQTTSVSVTMVDYSFTGMPSTLPCGTVNITEINAGQTDHNISFSGTGVTGGVGPIISAGATQSFSMTIAPGTYNYQCDVGDHAANGMLGSVSVH